MNKIKFAASSFAVLLAVFLLLNGCGKSEKDVTQNEKKQTQDVLDTIGKSGVETFYATADLKYWQNYPGKSPTGDAEMAQVKDPVQISKIRQDMTGAGKETVYTCEMHPQFHQNYAGKCPKCKMDLIPMNKTGTDTTSHNHEHMKM